MRTLESLGDSTEKLCTCMLFRAHRGKRLAAGPTVDALVTIYHDGCPAKPRGMAGKDQVAKSVLETGAETD